MNVKRHSSFWKHYLWFVVIWLSEGVNWFLIMSSLWFSTSEVEGEKNPFYFVHRVTFAFQATSSQFLMNASVI